MQLYNSIFYLKSFNNRRKYKKFPWLTYIANISRTSQKLSCDEEIVALLYR